MLKILTILFFALFPICVFTQPSTYVSQHIPAKGSFQLANKSIIPGTLHVKGFDSSFYRINYTKAIFTWIKPTGIDSTNISFRTFTFNWHQAYQKRNYDSVKNNFIVRQNTASFKNIPIANNILPGFGNIQYAGSLGRNISFGNTQDAVLNAQLNLQISGYIGDSILLTAAITDNNMPIQPDGTTSRLNEFDRILIQFKKKNWQANLGDIDIRENKSYFLNFYKRLQGASFQTENKLGNNIKHTITAAAAIAKGKFNRQILQVQEGNQGPYRLSSANNELFFVILANTERVFMDGILLQRGEDQDYIINYNTAEISFTPKHLITKDKRIQIEFEYTDRNFLNTALYINNEITISNKWQFKLGFYNSGDAKNTTINQVLSSQQKNFLANLGDSIQNAFYPFEQADSFALGKIMYAKIKSPIGNDSIYVYSTNKDSARYLLNFVEVGANKGNYQLLLNNANGKVYKWIAPVNGIKQGNFEPAQFLVTPKNLRIINTEIRFKPNENSTVSTEWAMSSWDVNLFSAKDKQDNKGYATKWQWQYQQPQRNTKWRMTNAVGFEWVSANFQPAERLRLVEFYREWGLPILNTNKVNELLPNASISLQNNKNGNIIEYKALGYLRSDDFSGYKHQLNIKSAIASWQVNQNWQFTHYNNKDWKGYFLKPQIQINHTIKWFSNNLLQIDYLLERNIQQTNLTDTITPGSFSFSVFTAAIKSNVQATKPWSLTYFTRSDQLPGGLKMLQSDRSHNFQWQYDGFSNEHHQLKTAITYRSLTVQNANISNVQADKSLLSRIEYRLMELKNALQLNVLYETGAGQEQRRDFSYIEVQQGRGEYMWIDYNNDGIQQLNEFEVAQFPDQAKFIRLFTPTNQFVKAAYSQLNYNFLFQPRNLWGTNPRTLFEKILTKTQWQSSWQSNAKQLATQQLLSNPLPGKIPDSSLLTVNSIFNHTLSINRFQRSWGLDLNWLQTEQKSLLTYGFEKRNIDEFTIRFRTIFYKQLAFEWLQKWHNNQLQTPAFANRNFEIVGFQTEPKLSYVNGTIYRLQASYQYIQRENMAKDGGQQAKIHSIITEAKWNMVQKNSLTAKFTYADIQLTGQPNTAVSFVMLNGLNTGRNFLWNLELTKRLGNSLEMMIQYEGRKPGNIPVIHIGRASIRAIF